tara:strand:- start:780 stop:1535 length:756 start_codon:yes stop_codon:yes gene_type:complete
MKKNTKVSIVMPNYNSYLYLEKTIKSIINQTFTKWELIIIDDRSNIKTRNILKKFKKNKKIKIYFLKSNKGDGYCRLFGVKKSSTNHIAFIDSDDIWKKNKLKLQYNFMTNNNYDFTYTNYESFSENKFPNRAVYPPKRLNYKTFINNTSIATSSMIVKKEFLKNLKLSHSPNFEDYYLKCQILKKIKYAYCLQRNLVKYRLRNNSLSKDKLRNIFWLWKINRKFNKLNLYDSLISLILISFHSLKKYGIK